MSTSYQYTALPNSHSIRLIYLKPGEADSPLRCQLRTVRLNALPDYEAISYAWGEPDFSCELWIQEDESRVTPSARGDLEGPLQLWIQDKKLRITPSLSGALQRMRLESSIRVLWADAVYISQTDIDERSHQVSLMRMIYSHATRVLIWLGPSSEEVPNAWALAQKILALYNKEMRLMEGIKKTTYSVERNKRQGLPPLESRDWAQLNLLLDRPYFHRAWIIQEVRLARNAWVLCGSFEMLWNDLEKVSRWLVIKRYASFTNLSATSRPYAIGKTGTAVVSHFYEGKKLCSLLSITRHQTTTDSRDKLYSILGLANEAITSEDTRLLPNYSKSTVQVYRDVTKYIIEVCHEIEVLSMIQINEKLASDFPSWVPRLDTPYIGSQIGLPGHPGLQASKQLELPLPVIKSPDEDALMLRGIRFDPIDNDRSGSTTHALGESQLNSEFDSQMFNEVWSSVCSKALAYQEGWDRIVAFYLTMTASTTARGISADQNLVHWDNIHAYEKQILRAAEASGHEPPTRLKLWETDASDEGDPDVFEHLMCEMWKGRKAFITARGYIGLGPNTLRSGDIVCILFGSGVPFVLRSMGTHWQFIGECYVHGIMMGEALKDFDGDTSAAELFELR